MASSRLKSILAVTILLAFPSLAQRQELKGRR